MNRIGKKYLAIIFLKLLNVAHGADSFIILLLQANTILRIYI